MRNYEVAAKVNKIRLKEIKRILHLEQSGSLDRAVDFCKQGLVSYTNALSTGYGSVYEEQLKVSLGVYREYLAEYEDLIAGRILE